MKEKTLLSCIISFCFAAGISLLLVGSHPAKADPTIPGDWDSTVNHCRCKDKGCYGGNALSFRSSCAKSDFENINCRLYDRNCNGSTPPPPSPPPEPA